MTRNLAFSLRTLHKTAKKGAAIAFLEPPASPALPQVPRGHMRVSPEHRPELARARKLSSQARPELDGRCFYGQFSWPLSRAELYHSTCQAIICESSLIGSHRALFCPFANGLNFFRARHAERLRALNLDDKNFCRELLPGAEG